MGKGSVFARRIVAVYLLAGAAWIIFSDRLLAMITRDPATITRVSIFKGWIFVAVTALLLYWLIRRYVEELASSESALMRRNEELAVVEEELRQQVEEFHHSREAHRESEQRYRLLFESNPHPMWVYDLETLRFLAVNDAAVEHYGYSREEFLAMTIKGIRPPEDLPALLHNVAGVTAGIDRAGIWRHLRKDGTEIQVEITSHTLDFGGRPAEVVLANDVTGRVRAEQEIQRLNVELEKRVAERTGQLAAANRELASFSYSVSHDLRAPLRHVDGYSRILLEDFGEQLDDEGKRLLQRQRSAVQRMGQLIDDLLKLADVTRRDINRQPVNLSSMAQAIAQQLMQGSPERNVEFRIAEGLVAHGDARLLRVVLENLLGNAFKYTGRQEKGRIEFGAGENGGEAFFFVGDNGVGFDMAYADKLFGAFQRLHHADEFEGSGIGLATVQRIISRHGGRIWADAEPGRGATFCFTLPG